MPINPVHKKLRQVPYIGKYVRRAVRRDAKLTRMSKSGKLAAGAPPLLIGGAAARLSPVAKTVSGIKKRVTSYATSKIAKGKKIGVLNSEVRRNLTGGRQGQWPRTERSGRALKHGKDVLSGKKYLGDKKSLVNPKQYKSIARTGTSVLRKGRIKDSSRSGGPVRHWKFGKKKLAEFRLRQHVVKAKKFIRDPTGTVNDVPPNIATKFSHKTKRVIGSGLAARNKVKNQSPVISKRRRKR